MASPRTVAVTVLLQSTLPLSDAGEYDALTDILRVCPTAGSVLNGMRTGGWQLDSTPRAEPNLGSLSVTFRKQFAAADPITACEDARACGVSDELGPIFHWAPDTGDDDDGAWDHWHGEL